MRYVKSISVVVLTFVAASLAAQEQGSEYTADAAASVPQEFDWYTATPVPAQTSWGQAIDVASTELIRSWTTMPEYTNPAVDYLPEHPTVVSPTDHFGYPIGKPGVLHRVEEIYGYFERLAASSPRVQFEMLGATEEGNRLALVQLGSEANLARLDEIKAGLNALSDPRTTTPDEAKALIDELPVVYAFYAGLHSTETGPPEMVMELAYRLAVSDDPAIRLIRDSTVIFIVPVAEPDGRNRVVDWHRLHNAETFVYEDRTSPPYWGKYIYHDNNRDGLQLSARLTQELVGLFNEWRYPIGHDLHESVPYLYVSTGTGPYNPDLDPIAVSEWQWLANKEVNDLTAAGMPGVWTHGYYDGWYPGYLLWVTNTRNAVGRFYETFGSSVPNTMLRTLEDDATRIEWYRQNPPRDTTIWSLRNNTNYMQSGVLSVLGTVASSRTRVLEQYWTKANNSLDRGRNEAPYAYVVPTDQSRREDVEYMLNLVRRQGIELHRADADASFGDVEVREGDYVVRMDQPYRNFAKMLMDVQHFPDDAPRPYDDTAWTFPLMFNATVHAVDSVAVQGVEMSEVTDSVTLAGSLANERRAEWWVVVPEASAHSLSARYALGEVSVWAAEGPIQVGDREVPVGSWLIDAAAVPADRARQLATDYGLTILGARADAIAEVERHQLDLPRIAVLHSWRNTQDEGWVRYTLDQAGVPYTYLGEDRLGELDLRSQADVIIFPSQGANASAKQIFQGVDTRRGPLAYTRTDEFPSLGFPDSSPDITGGMDYEGLAALRDFIHAGGTLITLGSASRLPIEYGLVRDVTLASPEDVFIPGSIIRGKAAATDHPILYGFGEDFPLYHRFGPYLNVPDRLEDNVLIRYAAADSLFLSGLVQNPDDIADEPAIVSVPVGQGHAVLFGFNPLHRHQSHGNFAFVWNAVMNWNDLDVGLISEPPDEIP
ncbi:MAG: peptidase [Gemmatimonas sp.]|nr:peptidase [Gemmatimonas sp.]